MALWPAISRAADDPVPVPAGSPGPRFCGIVASGEHIWHKPDTLAFSLSSMGRAFAMSGSLVAYVSGARYEIPFRNSVVSPAESNVVPTPIVVRFAGPVELESVYLASAGPPGAAISCTVFGPSLGPKLGEYNEYDWMDHEHDTDLAVAQQFLKQANAAVPQPAPVPQAEEPLSCTTPYRRAKTTHAALVLGDGVPYGSSSYSLVSMLLGADGTIIGYRVMNPAKFGPTDTIAERAVLQSTFQAEIYRCSAVGGIYDFLVDFSGADLRSRFDLNPRRF